MMINLANLFALLAGSSALTTVGVYLLARFTTVFDAYGKERAKLLARFADLDKIVQETERITSAAEIIKAKISDQTWDRQARWTYKRDVYIRVIQAVGRLRSGLARLITSFKSEQENASWAEEEAKIAYQEASEANNELLLVYDIAPVVLSDNACQILGNVLGAFKPKSSDLLKNQLQERMEAVKRELEALRKEARMDLGYNHLPRDVA